jgi:hypothetical protein
MLLNRQQSVMQQRSPLYNTDKHQHNIQTDEILLQVRVCIQNQLTHPYHHIQLQTQKLFVKELCESLLNHVRETCAHIIRLENE